MTIGTTLSVVWSLLFYAGRWFAIALIGISIATMIGAYTPRLIRYAAFPTFWSYLAALIRSDMPSIGTLTAAVVAASLGAFAFFPAKLYDVSGGDNFMRRIVRVIAVLILLFYVDVLVFDIPLETVPALFNSTDGTFPVAPLVPIVFLVQGGALVAAWVIGFIVRRLHSHRPSDSPRWITIVGNALSVTWYIAATLLVIWSTTLITTQLLPSYTPVIVHFLVGSRSVVADAMQSTIAAIAVSLALLFYIPPARTYARAFVPMRILGSLACITAFVLIFRSTPEFLSDTILNAAALAAVVAVSMVPVFRAAI